MPDSGIGFIVGGDVPVSMFVLALSPCGDVGSVSEAVCMGFGSALGVAGGSVGLGGVFVEPGLDGAGFV